MMSHQFKQPTPIRETAPGVPDGLSTVIDRLMQKAPEARYAGVDDLVEALQPYAVAPLRTGSRFGQTNGLRVAASNPGSRFPTPIPAAPPAPPTSSAQVRTPPGGPLTPVPEPLVAPSHHGGSLSSFGNGPSSHVFGGSADGSRTHRPLDGSKLQRALDGSKPHRALGPTAPPPAAPAPAPVAPSRFGSRLPSSPVSQSQVPTAVERVMPVAVAAAVEDDVPFAEPANARVTALQDSPSRRGMSLLFKALVVVTTVIGVFVIGKAFLFQN
jgi:serine/threonine-protein kinase